MATHAFTLRLPTQERQALENLSRVEGRPMNQILNDAIRAYLHRQSDDERRLEESLQHLRAYRERDPEFKESIAAVAAAEAIEADPLEGVVLRKPQEEHSSKRKAARGARSGAQAPSASGQSRLRTLLNA